MSNTLPLHKILGASPEEVLQKRQEMVRQQWPDKQLDSVFSTRLDLNQVMNKNCENMIGSIEVPLGLAGPTKVLIETEDKNTQELELWIPLATTEGALVASVSRGMKLLNESGGAHVLLEKKGMSRAPVFECANGSGARKFKDWLESHQDLFSTHASQFSSHLHFMKLYTWIEGRHVYARFHFDTDEAMGMNMITIFLEQLFEDELKNIPDVKLVAISSNACNDKKPATINALLGRGWWTQAEAQISHEHLKNILHTSARALVQTHVQKNLVGSAIAGSLGRNAHVANVAAAFYLATGQDIAQTVNASLATTTIEETEQGIYVAVTLPEIDVGSVGGGTVLTPQTQARNLICQNPGITVNSQLLATTVAVGCLAGELSLMGAFASHQVGAAHQKLGRGQA